MLEDTIWTQEVSEAGHYDVIGDVHGCHAALRRLCDVMGYDASFRHPSRKLVFVGDLINRGPDSVSVLRTAIGLVESGNGLAVLGNHDDALLRWLAGKAPDLKDDLQATIHAIDDQPDRNELWARIRRFYETRPLILDLDEGRLWVVHAGLKDDMRHRRDEETRRYLLNGKAVGKSPEGKTLREDWAREYRGTAFVAYGHTPVPRAEIRFNTVNIDTGAVRGGPLTALRWPEKTTISVP
jgi:protein phosphatase